MSNYDLHAIMQRFPVLAKEALLSVDDANGDPQTCDAVSYWPYQQEAFPYWWHRIESMAVLDEPGGDMEIHNYTISAVLVVAHLTEGYAGDPQAKAYKWIPAYLDYMRQHQKLYDGTTYTSAPDWLWTEAGGCRVTGIPNGTRTLANSGIGVAQLAVQFTLELPLLFEVY